ncbi:MAG: hypothetical protein ACODAU_06485 [Myxococcota bacterium]
MLAAVVLTTASTRAQDVFEDPRLAPVREGLEETVEAARADGLPQELLTDKVREGLAKRVPPPRIAAAVRMMLGHMRTADRMVRGVPPHAEVGRHDLVRYTTEALMAGADAGPLGRLVEAVAEDAAPKQAAPLVREGMVVVAELAERGIEGSLAARSALQAYRTQGRRGWGALLRAVRTLGRASPAERARAVRQAAERPGRGAPGLDGHPHGGPKGRAKGKGQ